MTAGAAAPRAGKDPALPSGWRRSVFSTFKGPAKGGAAPNVTFEEAAAEKGATAEAIFREKEAALRAVADLSIEEEGELAFLGKRRRFVRYRFKIGRIPLTQTLAVAVKDGTVVTAVVSYPSKWHEAVWPTALRIIAGFAPIALA